MATFNYKLKFSPYSNRLKAKNLKDAKKTLKKSYPEYKDILKCVEFLSYK